MCSKRRSLPEYWWLQPEESGTETLQPAVPHKWLFLSRNLKLKEYFYKQKLHTPPDKFKFLFANNL